MWYKNRGVSALGSGQIPSSGPSSLTAYFILYVYNCDLIKNNYVQSHLVKTKFICA